MSSSSNFDLVSDCVKYGFGTEIDDRQAKYGCDKLNGWKVTGRCLGDQVNIVPEIFNFLRRQRAHNLQCAPGDVD